MATNKQKLLRQLKSYGYSLLEPELRPDPNDLLAEMVLSRDARILEGFPVVLANAMSDPEKFSVKKAQRRLRRPFDQELFRAMMQVSIELCQLYGVRLPDHRDLREFADKKQIPNDDRLLAVGGLKFQPERLKRVFRDYFMVDLSQVQMREHTLHDEFQTEYLLSHLFTPRQKQLVMKKLYGEKMTKTEREYFSRTVKKKLTAMADPDLQRLAQKALQ
jgi:hypothetical protein